jgi:cobalamin biosynthesis protein CobD/CbiB
MTSHVRLNYVYRLLVYAESELKEPKYLVKPVVILLKVPALFDKAIARTYAKVMGVAEVAALGVVQRRGLLQLIVKSSAKAELLTSQRAIVLSEFLQFLQRSLSKSTMVSSLLSGVLLTIALLFLVLRSP